MVFSSLSSRVVCRRENAYGCRCFFGLAIEAEADGHGVFHIHGLAALCAWDPGGHGVDHAEGLSIEQGIDRLHDAGIADAAVFPYHEGGEDAPLFAGLLCLSGVFDGLGEETEEFLHAARELGHLLDHIEDVFRSLILLAGCSGAFHLKFCL